MPFGVVVSLMLHASLIAWSVVSLQSTKPLNAEETTAITVAIITPSELTRLKQGDPDAKKLEAKPKDEPKPDVAKKEAPKPKPLTAPPPPASEPPPPAPDPIADKLAEAEAKAAAAAKKKAAEAAAAAALAKQQAEREAEQKRLAEAKKKAEEKKKAEAKKKAEVKKRAELKKKKAKEKKRKEALRKKRLAEKRRKEALKKKRKFDADRIAALIDKSLDKRGAPKRSPTNPKEPTDYTGPTAGERRGRDNVLSAREIDLLKGSISAQLRNCWRLPGGGGGIESVVVTLQWRLRPDGSLNGEPRVKYPQNGPVFRIAAEAAIRAVKTCAPFRLPPDKYTAWKSITWDFDPREML